MKILKNKRAFLDFEVLTSAGFIILFLLAFSATALGYIWSKKSEWAVLPMWQLILIVIVEFIAAYFFASRSS